MRNRVAAFITVFVLINIIITGCEQKQVDTSKLAPQDTFEYKCSHCHDLPGTSTYHGDEWVATVARMQSKSPEWISDEDAKKIAGYLSSVSSVKK